MKIPEQSRFTLLFWGQSKHINIQIGVYPRDSASLIKKQCENVAHIILTFQKFYRAFFSELT